MKFKIETNLYDDGKPMFCKRQIEIEPGLTFLVGCNGSGKTTLLDQIRTIVRDKEIPYIKYNNLTDGNETSYSMSMAAYFGNFEQMSATFSSSEGENIALSLGRIAEKIGRKIKECEEDHKTQLFIFMDGIDSGLSIDAIEDVKKYLFGTIFQRAKDLDVYLIVSANDYTLTINERCLDVYTGDYKRFASYESYYKFILQSRERKDQRFV